MVNIIYDYSAKCKTETDCKIANQEHKDTYIVATTLGDLFPNENITVTQTPQYTNYDLNVEFEGKKKQMAMEVKEYNLSEENEKKYGRNVLLKVEKLDKMVKKAKEGNKRLFYTVILNKKEMLIFDCDNIDWETITVRNIKQKITQFDPNSGYVWKPTYIIPIKLAKITKDCSLNYWFYEEFENKPNFTINA